MEYGQQWQKGWWPQGGRSLGQIVIPSTSSQDQYLLRLMLQPKNREGLVLAFEE
jgi:hypothetical protein